MVFDESDFDEIDHFHPNFDESVPNLLFTSGCVLHVVTLSTLVNSTHEQTRNVLA